MSSFLSRLSGGKKDKEKEKADKEQKAAAEHNHEDVDIGSAAERGDEPDEEPHSSSSHAVVFSTLHNSLVKQRQGVIPHISQRVWGGWTEDDLTGTKVRGASYLSDNVKVACGPPLYTLVHVDIFYRRKDEERITSATSLPDSYLHSESFVALSATRGEWAKDPAAATIIINLAFPGPKSTNMNWSATPLHTTMHTVHSRPSDRPTKLCITHSQLASSTAYSLSLSFSLSSQPFSVMYFLRRVPPADHLAKHLADQPHDDTLVGVEASRVRAFDVTLRRFRQGSDEYRAGKLKIIPRVAEGGYIVKKSIGRVPALLGKKLKMVYTFNESLNSIEMTGDVGSSAVAGKIISLIKNTCEKLVVDMTFLLQGDSGDELPESVIGGVRIAHCNMNKIPHYEENIKLNEKLTHAEGEMAAETTTQNSGERSSSS